MKVKESLFTEDSFSCFDFVSSTCEEPKKSIQYRGIYKRSTNHANKGNQSNHLLQKQAKEEASSTPACRKVL